MQINPSSGAAQTEHLRYFHFTGRLLGKARFRCRCRLWDRRAMYIDDVDQAAARTWHARIAPARPRAHDPRADDPSPLHRHFAGRQK